MNLKQSMQKILEADDLKWQITKEYKNYFNDVYQTIFKGIAYLKAKYPYGVEYYHNHAYNVDTIADFEHKDDESFVVFFEESYHSGCDPSAGTVVIAYNMEDQEKINNQILGKIEEKLKESHEENVSKTRKYKLKQYEKLKEELNIKD